LIDLWRIVVVRVGLEQASKRTRIDGTGGDEMMLAWIN